MAKSLRPLIAASLPIALLCFAGGAWPATGYGRISGVVHDPAGTPQMGATIWVSPEAIGGAAIQLLSDQNGIFANSRLRPGLYSVRVTLAGFLPAVEEHIRIQADLTTLVGVELQSLLASIDQLRRPPPQPSQNDDWKWVLRSASSTRPILQWREGNVVVATVGSSDELQPRRPRILVEMTTGGHPAGSLSNSSYAPETAVSYDQKLGRAGRLLLAGGMSYGPIIGSGVSLASIWVPSGEFGRGPETTFVMRQGVWSPSGQSFRQMRAEHSEQVAFGDNIVAEFGAEYLMAGGTNTVTSALRPGARVLVHIAPRWIATISVETEPGSYALRTRESDSSLESALDAMDTLPIRVWQNGRATIAGGWHEEAAIKREVGAHGSLEVAAFHDYSRHQVASGFDTVSNCSLPEEDCSSQVYAHDTGAGGSWGTRAVYQQKISQNLEVAAVYAWAGALTPDTGIQLNLPADLGASLHNSYVQSVAGKVSGKIPRLATQLSASYKWLSQPVVSRQDIFEESALGVDPHLSFSLRQPLPSFLSAGHWEARVDVRNVLSQGYVSMNTQDGQVVFVPVMRSFRGGLSVQF